MLQEKSFWSLMIILTETGNGLMILILLKKSPNIILVLCGHKEGTFQKEVIIKDPADTLRNRKVFEILSDFQDEKSEGSDKRSGNGLLRVLKIYPEKNEIGISTVSALTGKTQEEEIHLFLGE